MKRIIMLLLVLVSLGSFATAAAIKTLQVDFSAVSATGRTVKSYRLYQEGLPVCNSISNDITKIRGIKYLPRQDGGVNGTIANYEIYTSIDGVNWGIPVAKGAFDKAMTEKEVLFTPVIGKFLRLVALSEINGGAWTSLAELKVLYETTDAAGTKLPDVPWSITFVDSEETAKEDGKASNAFDGIPETLWHTQWSPTAKAYPHEISINLVPTSSMECDGIVLTHNTTNFTMAAVYIDDTESPKSPNYIFTLDEVIPPDASVVPPVEIRMIITL